jgi:carbonic anhydrase/acetyltransferase-like protein (isoleucine patch superfamily)
MKKKYELVKTDFIKVGNKKLYRIRALKDFFNPTYYPVNAGDLGGYIQSEDNLSHEGTCWISDDCKVYGKASVGDDALLQATTAYGSAVIRDQAHLADSEVSGNIYIRENATVEDSVINGNATVGGKSSVYSSEISGYAYIGGEASITDSKVSGNAVCVGDCQVEEAKVSGFAKLNFKMVVCWDVDKTPASVNTIDGYTMTLDSKNGKISAGCRYFDFEAARRHWRATRPTTAIGEERLDQVDYLEYVYKRKPNQSRHF